MKRITGHVGPKTVEKCRIRGARLESGRVSIMTATLEVGGGCVGSSSREEDEEESKCEKVRGARWEEYIPKRKK